MVNHDRFGRIVGKKMKFIYRKGRNINLVNAWEKFKIISNSRKRRYALWDIVHLRRERFFSKNSLNYYKKVISAYNFANAGSFYPNKWIRYEREAFGMRYFFLFLNIRRLEFSDDDDYSVKKRWETTKYPCNKWIKLFFKKLPWNSTFRSVTNFNKMIEKAEGSPVKNIKSILFFLPNPFNYFSMAGRYMGNSNSAYSNHAMINLINLITNFGQGLESSYFTTGSSNFYYYDYKHFVSSLDKYIDIYYKKKDQNLKNLWNFDIYQINYNKYKYRIFKLAHIYLNKHYKINQTFGENIYFNFNIINFRNKINSNTIINQKTGWEIGTSWHNLINCFNNKTCNFWPDYFWKKDFYDEDHRHFINSLFRTRFSKTQMMSYDAFKFQKYIIKRICRSLLYLEVISMLDIMDIETIHNIKLEHEGVRHTFYTGYGRGGPTYYAKWKKGPWDYRSSILDKALSKLCNNYLMANRYRNIHRMISTSQCIKNKRIYEWTDRLIPAPPNHHPEAWWYRKVVGRYTSGLGASFIQNKFYLNFYFLSFKYNSFNKDLIDEPFLPEILWKNFSMRSDVEELLMSRWLFFYKNIVYNDFNYFTFKNNKFDWKTINENKIKTQILPYYKHLSRIFRDEVETYLFFNIRFRDKYLHCDRNMNLFNFYNFSSCIFDKKYSLIPKFNYFKYKKKSLPYNNKFGLICEVMPSWNKIKLYLEDLKEFNEIYQNANIFKKIEILKENKAYYFHLIFKLNYVIIISTGLLIFINKLFLKSINNLKKNNFTHPTYKLGQFLYENNIAQTIANKFNYYLIYLIFFFILILCNYFFIDILNIIDYFIYFFFKSTPYWWHYLSDYVFVANSDIFPWNSVKPKTIRWKNFSIFRY